MFYWNPMRQGNTDSFLHAFRDASVDINHDGVGDHDPGVARGDAEFSFSGARVVDFL